MTIKEIRTFAKEKGFTLPIKATKEVLIHSIKEIKLVMLNKLVIIMFVCGLKIVKELLKIKKKAMNKAHDFLLLLTTKITIYNTIILAYFYKLRKVFL